MKNSKPKSMLLVNRASAAVLIPLLLGCSIGVVAESSVKQSQFDYARVSQVSGKQYLLEWNEEGPVDVYVSDDPQAKLGQMRLISESDADGKHKQQVGNIVRPYFAVVNKGGEMQRVSNRELPLQGSSNFRDMGGYPAADGKHVVWGKLFRSGAMYNLTENDYDYLAALDVAVVCDLRSNEERELSPTNWKAGNETRYYALDYSADKIFGRVMERMENPKAWDNKQMGSLYGEMPEMFKTQYREMFKSLVAGEAPLAVNCSAGQDRTGLASALILSALGVEREVIYRDYHLSTELRRPENEMAERDDMEELAKTNIVAKFKLMSQQGENGKNFSKPQPLMSEAGKAHLAEAFERIEKDYGSVTNYLDKALGVDAVALAKLRSMYTE